MLGVLVDSDNKHSSINREIARQLFSYGVNEVSKLNNEVGLASLADRDDATEALFIYPHPELSNQAIRRLTLSSVRMSTTLLVWDGPAQSRLVAARAPLDVLRQCWIQNKGSLDDLVENLRKKDSVTSCTIQQLTSNDELRVGGSFSKSGVRRYFFKHGSGRGTKKLLDEIKFYRSLPPTLCTNYPQLLFAEQNEQGVSMATEYQDYPNLRDLLLNLQIEPAEAVQLLQQVLDYEYRLAFRPYQQTTPENYLHDYHYHRVWRRIAISTELDPAFAGLVKARWLQVNGRRIPNIAAMLLRLEQDEGVAKRLNPRSTSPFIHADLHLENILYDVSGRRFWLVDPRGYPSCDIFYDLGKLAHSYNSKYDLLHEGRHETSYELRGDTAVVEFSFTSSVLVDIYDELNRCMQPVIHDLLGAHERKEDIDLRVRFNEAMHFCSDMPFHIHPDAKPNIAVPIFAIGAQLLAEVLRLLDIDVEACADQQSEGLCRLALMGERPWRFEG